MNERRNIILLSFLLTCTLGFVTAAASAQTPTTFTYQGRLTDGGTPANARYDLQFALYDAQVGGAQTGGTQTLVNVMVTNGISSVQLDFGEPPFTSTQARFLEVGVRPGGTAGAFTLLAPRQPITSAPYAIRSLTATAADGLSVACLSCVTSNQISSVSGSVVNGEIPLASVPAGSANYIQNNPASQQAGANFNISGNSLVGGNIGIGTTSPAAHLHVANASDSGAGLIVEASEGDRAAMYYNPNTGLVFDSFRPSDGRRLPVLLQPSGGNVGIGTTNPQTKLEVQTFGYGITQTDGTVRLSTYTDGSYGWLGTKTNHPLLFYTNSTFRMGLDTSGNVGIGTIAPSTRLNVIGGSLHGVYSSSSFRGVWGDSTGNLGIGVYGSSSASNGYGLYGIAPGSLGIGLYAEGLRYGGYSNGNVHVTGNFTNPSDARLKTGITNLRYGLSEVMRLRPVTWTWKNNADGKTQLGLIAQDVQPVLPELIEQGSDKDRLLSMNYLGLLPVVIKAIQEQEATITTLRNEIAGLQKQNTGGTFGTSVGIGTGAPEARLEVKTGNILAGSPGQGITLKSPDGKTCKLLSIDNGGTMVLTAVACLP